MIYSLILTCLTLTSASNIAPPPGVPTFDDFAAEAEWQNVNAQVSEKANITADQRDLPVINNFWGSVGTALQGQRPVDMFAINSLIFGKYVACGVSSSSPYGCGRLLIDGQSQCIPETNTLLFNTSPTETLKA